jgi:hypothetical protein
VSECHFAVDIASLVLTDTGDERTAQAVIRHVVAEGRLASDHRAKVVVDHFFSFNASIAETQVSRIL